MSWIKVINETEAQGQLKEIYELLKSKRGKLSNIMKVQSLNPQAMKAHLDLYLSIMFRKSGLSREEQEMIAVVVSAVNGCNYCVNHHAEALNFYWKNRGKLIRFQKNFRSVNFPERTRHMLEYAEKLTQSPDKICESDIQKLRSVGFSDGNILDINLIVSYFNFVNRIANGLGVHFDPEEVSGYKY